MSRTLPSTVSTAITANHTRPIYLIRMGWAAEVRSCTWGADITWNSETWTASGIRVLNLTDTGGVLEFPLRTDKQWLSLVLNESPRDRTVQVYEYQTDFTASPNASDAVLVFSGVMDDADISNVIRVRLVESATSKSFPHTSIDRPTYTHLVPAGTQINWGQDFLLAE